MPQHKPTSDDVAALARSLFAAEAPTVLELLAAYGTEPYEREIHRVRCAVLQLSGGNEARLVELIGSAKADYRDVLWWLAQKEAESGNSD